MRTIFTTILTALLISLASCGEKLNDVIEPTPDRPDGFKRFLAKVERIDYQNSKVLFSDPVYDNQGRIIEVYNNIAGYNSKYQYAYSSGTIVLTLYKDPTKSRIREYTLDNGLITRCVETGTGNNGAANAVFTYKYSDDGHLIQITQDDRVYDFHQTVTLEWDKRNIIRLDATTGNGYNEYYTFEYQPAIKYSNYLPPFYLDCYQLTSAMGLDEVLQINGYFGTSVSKDLLTYIMWNGRDYRKFNNETDEMGYLKYVKVGYRPEYRLSWM